MIKNKNVWLLGLLVSLAFGASLYAQGYGDRDDRDRDRGNYRGRWAHLGNAHVDGSQDHDNIRVGRRDGRFRAIQLRVSGGAIDFERVVVHYGNGSHEELIIHDRIPSGGRTRPIDLPGERRVIESVELWYARGSWNRRPRVDLYGLR
ncbi:MAG: hypothetical protein M3P45_04035 [Acidobacteriota bacterium]|nr:hypothetical protein [Acidobacteriota bacterium]